MYSEISCIEHSSECTFFFFFFLLPIVVYSEISSIHHSHHHTTPHHTTSPHHHTSILCAGVVAVMMRQTNIIWVGFLCVLLAADVLGARILKAPINTLTDAKVRTQEWWLW